MNADEIKRLRQFYRSLLGLQTIFNELAGPNVKHTAIIPLEAEIQDLNDAFPDHFPNFDKHPYFSHSSGDGVYYDLTAIQSFIATVIGRLHTAIEETSDIPDRVKTFGNKVFIVHGHDDTTKQTVARFLEKLDLDVVILHERPDKGKTIIEKLESNSSEVDIGYAVVLLTPDDVGRANLKPNKSNSLQMLYYRARQNVIFELGYFIAKLGRERVRAIYIEGVQLPSDYQGVLYTKLDDSGSWKLELASEIKAAGINLDMNKILKK